MEYQSMMTQPLIQTIGYRSDLRLLIRIRHWGQEPQKPFKFKYSTNNGVQTYTACFDGTKAYALIQKKENGKNVAVTVPLELCDTGIRLRIEGPFFQPGTLQVERRFFEDKEHFDTDNHDQVQHVTTSIQLVDKDNKIEGADYMDEVEAPRGETTFEQAKRQGYTGTREQYSKDLMGVGHRGFTWPTPEQGLVEIPGEFWPDSSGHFRQVYAFTACGTTPPYAGGFMISSRKLWQLQVVNFYVERPSDGDQLLYHSLHVIGINLACYRARPDGSGGGLAGSGVAVDFRNLPYVLIGKCTLEHE